MSPEFSRSKSPSHKVGCFLSKFSHFAPAGRAGTGAGEEAGWQLVAPEQAERQSWEGIWGEGWGPPLPASATCSAGNHPLLTAESKSPGGGKLIWPPYPHANQAGCSPLNLNSPLNPSAMKNPFWNYLLIRVSKAGLVGK